MQKQKHSQDWFMDHLDRLPGMRILKKNQLGAIPNKPPRSSQKQPIASASQARVAGGSTLPMDEGLNASYTLELLEEKQKERVYEVLHQAYLDIRFFHRLVRRIKSYERNAELYFITGKDMPDSIKDWWQKVQEENSKEKPNFLSLMHTAFEVMTDQKNQVPNNYEIFGEMSKRQKKT
tara:strand:- start:1624 stop:2157 length:534 start_codon:yes stop_codon:yes gene_type:complete